MRHVDKFVVGVRENQTGKTIAKSGLAFAPIAMAGGLACQGLEGWINSVIADATSTRPAG